MSRVRSENIRSTLTGLHDKTESKRQHLWFMPPNGVYGKDPVVWLQELVISLGYQDIPDALRYMSCPPRAMIAVVHEDFELREGHSSAEETLMHAAVLARVGNRFYDPDKPPVASSRRLERVIELIELPNETFYELD